MEQKWLTMLRTQTNLVRNSTYSAKGTFVPPAPCYNISYAAL